MKKIDEIEQVIRSYADIFEFKLPVQAFDTRNMIGDYMTTIYKDDKIQIDYCMGYDYIEMFGNNKMFKELFKRGIFC